MNDNNDNILSSTEVDHLLESIYKDLNIRPKEIRIDSGSNKGDGYMSFITRVDITTEDGKELHFAIKSAPRREGFRKMAPIRDTFLREILFYEEVAPIFRRFQTENHSMKSPFDSIPKFFKACKDDGAEVLVMENIKTNGFKLWDRMKYMDHEHIAFVLRTYGKFHALSYAMQQQDPECYKALVDKMACKVLREDNMGPTMMSMMTGIVDKVRDLFENEKPELYKKFLNYDSAAIWHGLDEEKSEFPVICHGDCWVNNMMFKYGDNPMIPTEMRLLDFQLMRQGSPVLDLSYFFYVSATKTYLDQLDLYLHIYHDSLSESLKEMNCNDVLSFDGLKREWKSFCKFGYNASLIASKIMMSEGDEVIDFANVNENDDDFVDAFNKEKKHDDFVMKKLHLLTLHMYDNDFL